VTVTVESPGNTVRISVRDKGPGIPNNFRSHVFDKFAQAGATDTRQKGGTGLGLSILEQITSRLGGEVGFEDASDPPMAKITPSQNEAGRPTILHVDDDADVLRLVVETMVSWADFVSVGSLSEARGQIKEKQFDLALIDLALGRESGLDLLPDLRDLEHRAIPVIVFSARCADLECDAQIKMTLDKSRTPLDVLLASVLDTLAPLPVIAAYRAKSEEAERDLSSVAAMLRLFELGGQREQFSAHLALGRF
jgi:CheY-like chemotaxis protein